MILSSIIVLFAGYLFCVDAVDFWQTDYHVGYTRLDGNSSILLSNVCNSILSWDNNTFDIVSHCDDSICNGRCCRQSESLISRARALYKTKDYFGASLFLCHNDHVWRPGHFESLETAVVCINLLGLSLYEISYFSGSRAAFDLGISILSQLKGSRVASSAIVIESFVSAELLLPATYALHINAAHVAVDAWDLASAHHFLNSSLFWNYSLIQRHTLSPDSQGQLPSVALDYVKYVLSLPEKPGLLQHMDPLVSYSLNVSLLVRSLRKSPVDNIDIDALERAMPLRPFAPDLSSIRYFEWPPHIVEGMISDLSVVISSKSPASVILIAVRALDGLVAMSSGGEASSHCHIARRFRVLDSLLYLLASSYREKSEISVTVFSVLTHLVNCDGALPFITAGGVEVLSSIINVGSKFGRSNAAKLMLSIIKNVAVLNRRLQTKDGLVAQGYLNRTVLRFTLSKAPLQIFHKQQVSSSLKNEDSLISRLLKCSENFVVYWKQLQSIMPLKYFLSNSSAHIDHARELVILRSSYDSTYARLAWFHSNAQDALLGFFGNELAASAFVIDSIPEDWRLRFNAPPHEPGQTGEYDPVGLVENFGAKPNHRDVFFQPPCAGIATNLLQCWIFKVNNKLPQEECDDSSLVTCHHFNGLKNNAKFPNISLPDFSTQVQTRHGLMHLHLLDLYFTASLSVYGEWSFLESQMISRYIPVGGTFLDVGAHVGTISVAIAEHVGSSGVVIAIEAQKNFCDLIQITADLNSYHQLSVIHAAVDSSNNMCLRTMISSSLGIATNFGGFEVSSCDQHQMRLMLTKDHRNSPSPTFYTDFGAEQAVVNTITIDSIVNMRDLTSLHAIKLDCEGSEHRALQGGLKSLMRFSPAIFFEDNDISWDAASWNSRPYSPTSEKMKALFQDLLQPLNYECFQHHVPVFNPQNFRGRSENLFQDQSSSVVVCTRDLRVMSDL